MSWAKVYVVKHPSLLSLCCGHIRQSPGCDIVQWVDAWAWIHCMRLADRGIARLAVTHWVIAEEIGYVNAHNAMSDSAPTDEEAATLNCVVSADASFSDCAMWIGELGRSACYSNGILTRKYVRWSHLLLDLAKCRQRRFDYGASHGWDISTVRLNFKVFNIALVLGPFSCMFRRGMNCEIIQSDCCETLKRVADMGGADLILTSPPYADARTYGAAVNWTVVDYQRLGDAVKPALKPGGHCLMVLDAPVREWRKGYGTERGFLPWLVMIDWAERVGLRVPDRLAYGRFGQPGYFKGRFRNDWEPLLWFQRPGAEGYFEPIIEPSKTGAYVSAGGGKRRQDGTYERQGRAGEMAEQGLRYRGTFWAYGICGAIAGEWDHPATFWLGFAEDAVRCFCPPMGLVCDPFTGSGTSAVAAAKHGRRFFGGDLLARPSDGKPWADVATERVRQATAQLNICLGDRQGI